MTPGRPEKGKRKKDRTPRRLFRQKREPVPPHTPRIVSQPAGREKMSEVLEEFVHPYLDLTDNADDYRKLLLMAVLAWNAALMPEEKRRGMIDDTLSAGLPQATDADRAAARALIEEMVRRKQDHFPANRRNIISFQVTDTGDGYHLLVASTV